MASFYASRKYLVVTFNRHQVFSDDIKYLTMTSVFNRDIKYLALTSGI